MSARDGIWKESADEFIRWTRANGREPRGRTADWVEERHARWMRTQRANVRLSEKRRRYLDRFAPGWDAIKRRPVDPGWEARFADVRYWVVKARRRPSASSDGEEMRAYRWLYRQTRYLPPEDPRRDRLVGAFDEWDRTHGWWPPQGLAERSAAAWQAKFTVVTTWVAENGSPSQRGGKESQAAYLWLWKQAKSLPSADPRRDQLAAALPGWDPVHGWW